MAIQVIPFEDFGLKDRASGKFVRHVETISFDGKVTTTDGTIFEVELQLYVGLDELEFVN